MGRTRRYRSKGRKLPGAKRVKKRVSARAPKSRARAFTPAKDTGPATYAERNTLLADLGYESYLHYLKSSLWHYIRGMAWRVHGPRCRLCRKRASQLHHTSYSQTVLLGQDLAHLVPLCQKCHDRVELKRDGSKRTWAEVKRAYKRLLRCCG